MLQNFCNAFIEFSNIIQLNYNVIFRVPVYKYSFLNVANANKESRI